MRSTVRSVRPGLETIVVATDFSTFAQNALHRTVQLARRFQSTILLTHVIDPILYSNALNGEPFVLRQAERTGMLRLEETAEILRREEIPHEVILRHGVMRETLCQIVMERNADLLVISSHGEHRFDREVYGSVAEKILRAAPCPVMVMGPLVCHQEQPASSPKRLLFPTAFSPHSLRLLPFVDALAHHLGADLHLLHVSSPAIGSSASHRRCMEKLEKTARANVSMTSAVHCMVQAGMPGEAISSVASSMDAAAIVLGVEQENLMKRPTGGLHQGLAYRIMTRTCCPVITLHSGVNIRALRATVVAEMESIRKAQLTTS
jgi:nucleotide-binding universal stress UspA family protein